MFERGEAGGVWYGEFRRVTERLGSRGEVEHVRVWYGMAWQAWYGKVGQGKTRHGVTGQA